MGEKGFGSPLAQGNFSNTPFAQLFVYITQRRLSGVLAVHATTISATHEPAVVDCVEFEVGTACRVRFPNRKPVSFEDGLSQLLRDVHAHFAFFKDGSFGRYGVEQGAYAGRVSAPLFLSRAVGSIADAPVLALLEKMRGKRLALRDDIERVGFQWPAAEQRFVEALRGSDVQIDQLPVVFGLDPRQAQRVIYVLLLTQSLVLARESAAAETRTTAGARASAPVARGSAPVVRPQAPSDLSSEHMARWSEIYDTFEAISEQDHFQALGVARDATAEQIKAAYLEAVKRWHPDRLPGPLAAARDAVHAVFQRMAEAHAVLSDPKRRAEYEEHGRDAPSADEEKAAAILEAALCLQRADVLLKKNDPTGALVEIEKSLALDPESAEGYMQYAWAQFLANSDPTLPVDAMLETVEHALSVEPTHSRAHYIRGMILKRAGRAQEALESFRRAAEFDPENMDAAREVRLAQRRSGSDQPSPATKSLTPAKKAGVFQRLFRRDK